ncbi:MAG: CHAT domain-containing protein [Pyrinomonadaceae bacterium]
MRTITSLFLLTLGLCVPALGQSVQSLAVGTAIEREIKGGETHSFSVDLAAGQTARIDVEQKGVDIALAASGPDGKQYLTSESPSGVLGSDLILVTAVNAGVHRVNIMPSDPRAAMGKYTVKLSEIRQTTAEDDAINEASQKITKVADDATVLRQNGTRDGRRKAIEKFQEVIDLSHIKKDKVWEIVALITTGLLYEQLGEVQRSLDYYLSGLALAREVGNRQYQGSAINNLAVGYLTLGEYETSVSYLTQALALQTESGNRRGQGVVFNNLGTAHLMLGNLVRSEEYYRQALAVRREVKDERGEGFALNNLGQVFLQSGDYPSARDLLDQALALRKRIADKQGEAVTLRNLGKLFFKIGNNAEAANYLKQAGTLSNELGDRRVEADTYFWLASIEARSGDVSKGIQYVEKGLGIIEQIRGEIINPQLRTGYFSTVAQYYELYADLLVSRGEKNNDEKDIALALQVSERARARTLVELLQEARVDIKKGSDEKKLDELQDTLNTKYRDRTTLLSGKPTTEQVAKITGEINNLTAEIENLQVKVRRENPAYADLTYGSALSSSEIRDLLDDKTVLLEYKLGDTRSLLWLVTKNTVRVFSLPARKEIEPIAASYHKAVSGGQAGNAEVARLEKDLNRILLAQVSGLIGKDRVVVVADGVLQFIPFSALPGLAGNETIGIPSAGVLAELRRTATERKAGPQKLAIFADPVFESNDSRLTNLAEPVKSKVQRDVNPGAELSRLLASRTEAREIAGLFPADQVKINLDFDANLDGVSGDSLKQFNIIHFATHGLLDSQRPESSSLVFSLFGKDGKPRDGFMRLKDVYDLNLKSDLVVLSACQTALGKDIRGEGLIGLTRGFMFAGASRVVASLWKVDDAATAEFMKRFYRGIVKEKLAPATALKKAQNELKAIPRYRYPYYWAGFTLQGDWR